MKAIALALLLTACGGGPECERNAPVMSDREQPQWVAACPVEADEARP